MDETTTSRLRRLRPAVQDALFALLLTALATASLAARPVIFMPGGGGHGDGPRVRPIGASRAPTPSLQAYALTAAAFLPLALRRRFPLSVLAITSAVAAIYEATHNPPSLVFIAPLIALYTVGTVRGRKTLSIAAVLSAALMMMVSLPAYSSAAFWTDAVRIISVYGVAAALGDATRNRRAYVAEVEQRAIEAERTRDEEAARRVDEERLRIARELHDVTAHSLSIIAVQSGAAAHVIDSNPAEARKALEAIRRTSKEALDELRAMLGVLRSPGDTDAPLAPVPGLGRLSELVAPLVEAGYTVNTDLAENLADVPAVVELSAYRIVQEALTNVVRHAGTCTVWLAVRREGDELLVSVDDDGATPPVSAPASGHGLEGMRERAVALGGAFAAGPRTGGGFSVSARLPFSGRSGS